MQEAQTTDEFSAQDFIALGLDDLAYVREMEVDGQTVFAVHAADGRQLTVLPSRELAVSTVLNHEMTPLSVH